MPSVSKAEHVTLRVENLADAVTFHTDVLGLVEITREDGTVYLGCGLDSNYDLAIKEGGTGVEHFAVQVARAKIPELEERLQEKGVTTERTDGEEPGQELGVRFNLPSGLTMEFVAVEDNDPWLKTDPAYPERGAHAPLDLDHHHVKSTDVKADSELLQDVADFKIPEIIKPPNGSDWIISFMRYGDFHHDLGFNSTDDPDVTLHHIGFEADSVDHLKQLIDTIAAAGLEFEMAMNRHVVGHNVFAYFWEPGGNRFEISTEMQTLDDDSPTEIITLDPEQGGPDLFAWGGMEIPDSFRDGS